MNKIYDDEFAEDSARVDTYADFVAIVRQLRRDCPWDREQTHASVRHLLIEETYEAVEAIDDEDWDALKEELGDLLLHVVFHSMIAEQDGRFTLQEVIERETAKLVRRHPHVFGEVEAEDPEAVKRTWEQIKMQEQEEDPDAGEVSILSGVPRQLPSLLRAYRMQQKAAGIGFDFFGRDGAWEKVEEELQELHGALRSEVDPEEAEEEFGDVLFALVNFARFAGLNPENALRRTNEKFTRRFQYIEQRLAGNGRSVDEADLEEMDRLWEEAKESSS